MSEDFHEVESRFGDDGKFFNISMTKAEMERELKPASLKSIPQEPFFDSDYYLDQDDHVKKFINFNKDE